MGIIFILGDVLLWITVVPVAALFPRAREPLLRAWAIALREATLASLRAAGARFEIDARVPCEGGILVVMNHQSLVDIPVVFRCVRHGYPRMVAHFRYGRGVPLVSHMMRLYGHIPVFPGRTGRAELDVLMESARTSRHPIVIFPEGHRTRDGEIRPFKRGGLDAFLSAREWRVYVVVVDGLWRSGSLTDLVRTIASVRCRAEAIGPIHYDGRGRDSHDEFVDRLRGTMCDKLAEMRARQESPPGAGPGLAVTGR